MFCRHTSISIGLLAMLILPCLLLALLKTMAGDWGGNQPYRMWTDNTGQFSAKARLTSDRGNSVVLERKDGRFVTVPLRRLSASDRQFLKTKTEAKEIFQRSFWKWNYSDPADLWSSLVHLTPLWVTVVVPVGVAAFGYLLYARRTD